MEKEQIKLIREKCIAANPEIMALKFGCRVQHESRIWNVLYEKFGCVWLSLDDLTICPAIKHITAILGRPITLADVLSAIGGAAPIHFNWSNKQGYFVSKSDELLESWNLRLSLEDQSPECLEFLANLLK